VAAPEFQAISASVSLILSIPCVDALTEATLAVELPYISPGVRTNMADFFWSLIILRTAEELIPFLAMAWHEH